MPQEPVPRLLYIVSEDWYFLSHRLPMARAARRDGFDVHVATRVSGGAEAIAAEGFTLHPIPFVRGRISLLGSLRTIAAVRRLHTLLTPDICHHVALQVAVFGSVAAIGKPAATVNAVTGFGFALTARAGFAAAATRTIVGFLLRALFTRNRSIALVQNPDDRDALLAMGVGASHISLIAGSGIDTKALVPVPEPDGPVTIGYAGRLLDDKGVRTLFAAYRLLRERGLDIRLLIAGKPDFANPTSLSEDEIARWRSEPGIELLGHIESIDSLWARAHIAVLPSRREGLPKALIEAAACGKPMVATDVPGCREVVIEGETGELVPVDDASALANAIARLAASPDLRKSYGAAARRRAVEKFDTAIVEKQIVALYRSLLKS
jgi:glycosyltransferase involved in cell wall biosynthesis